MSHTLATSLQSTLRPQARQLQNPRIDPVSSRKAEVDLPPRVSGNGSGTQSARDQLMSDYLTYFRGDTPYLLLKATMNALGEA